MSGCSSSSLLCLTINAHRECCRGERVVLDGARSDGTDEGRGGVERYYWESNEQDITIQFKK